MDRSATIVNNGVPDKAKAWSQGDQGIVRAFAWACLCGGCVTLWMQWGKLLPASPAAGIICLKSPYTVLGRTSKADVVVSTDRRVSAQCVPHLPPRRRALFR